MTDLLLTTDFLKYSPLAATLWNYYESNTMAVEVMKDDELHRVRFPVLYKVRLVLNIISLFD